MSDNIGFSPSVENVMPTVNAAAQASLKILAGTMQRRGDNLIADAVLNATRLAVSDQQIQNRIAMGQARAAAAANRGTEPNLDIVMQLALSGERAISRIKASGYTTAAQWRNAGDQALYGQIGETFFDLAEGFASSVERGLFRGSEGDSGPPAPKPRVDELMATSYGRLA